MAPPIVILGMHRSGTSALARVMDRLGVWMGSPEHKTRRNEHVLVQQVNQDLLLATGGHWSAPLDLDDGWTEEHDVVGLRAAAGDALADLVHDGPYAWKDPRSCLTLPFWQALLPERPVAVVSYRHPLEVGASLAKRNDFGPGHTHALWERYNRALLRNAAGLPTAVVCFADLARDPIASLERLVASLAAVGVEISGDVAHAAEGIEPDRRHHVFDEMPDGTITPQQAQLWSVLESLDDHYDALPAFDLPPVHAASAELLTHRAALLRAERDATELRRQLRSRRDLLRALASSVVPARAR